MNVQNSKKILAALLLGTLSHQVLLAPPTKKPRTEVPSNQTQGSDRDNDQKQPVSPEEEARNQERDQAQAEQLKAIQLERTRRFEETRAKEAKAKEEAEAETKEKEAQGKEEAEAKAKEIQKQEALKAIKMIADIEHKIKDINTEIQSLEFVVDMARAERMEEEEMFGSEQITKLTEDRAELNEEVQALRLKYTIPNAAATTTPAARPADDNNDIIRAIEKRINAIDQEVLSLNLMVNDGDIDPQSAEAEIAAFNIERAELYAQITALRSA